MASDDRRPCMLSMKTPALVFFGRMRNTLIYNNLAYCCGGESRRGILFYIVLI